MLGVHLVGVIAAVLSGALRVHRVLPLVGLPVLHLVVARRPLLLASLVVRLPEGLLAAHVGVTVPVAGLTAVLQPLVDLL